MKGALYLVSTPIGNLKDITYRAVETLRQADVIACEDTRRSRILLSHYGIQKPLISVFQGREHSRSRRVLEELEAGRGVAFITDAGTPTIQDPGFPLVRDCLKEGIPVVPVPGACAAIAALSASGLPTDSFLFEGYLPVKPGPRRKKIESWKGKKITVVFYESPHRILRTLQDMRDVLGDAPVVVAREITKKFEEILRVRLDEALERFGTGKPRGEFVVLL